MIKTRKGYQHKGYSIDQPTRRCPGWFVPGLTDEESAGIFPTVREAKAAINAAVES